MCALAISRAAASVSACSKGTWKIVGCSPSSPVISTSHVAAERRRGIPAPSQPSCGHSVPGCSSQTQTHQPDGAHDLDGR
jgi:hypothetical protein